MKKDCLVHLYYGDGKGKTTAAVGLALRAIGQKMPVVFCQFLKDDRSGELTPLQQQGADVLTGTKPQKFTFRMNELEKRECAAAQEARLVRALNLSADQGGMLVLDEFVDAVEKGFVRADLVQQVLQLQDRVEIVMTGHSAPTWAVEAADYVTEMKCCKHPFQHGISARKGIEY